MSVDQYSICPCGSGKKIKFCKCKDSVGELDKVLTMFEGGQLVPALDRLTSILGEHPDAAWALALKGRLLMDLREYDSLAENAERFIRLQPSNPLALTQRAAAKIFTHDMAAATESLLEALNESGRNVDSFVMDVATILAIVLGQNGNVLSARVYAMLSAFAQGYENNQAVGFLGQLDAASTMNHRLKSVPTLIERPADAEWGERCDEAVGLLHNNKVLMAQSKFESLRRTASGEPSVLSGLLLCAVWRGDIETQYEMLKQLADCDSLDFSKRCDYRALAALIQPKKDIAVSITNLTADIENVEETEMAMIASDHMLQLPGEVAKQFVESEDDVPPRSVFRLTDRPILEGNAGLPAVTDVPVSEAVVLLYGKQTDRAARVEALEVIENEADDIASHIQEIIGNVTFERQESPPMPLLEACENRPAANLRQGSFSEIQGLMKEFSELHQPTSALNLGLPILGGRSLGDVADDESLLMERTVVVRILESYERIGSNEKVISAIRDGAKIEALPTLKLKPEDLENGIANEDIHRIDTSELGAEELWYLMSRCEAMGIRRKGGEIARQLLASDLSDDQDPLRLQTYAFLLSTSDDPSEAIKTVDEAIAFAKIKDFKFAQFLLAKLELNMALADDNGFKETIGELDANYRNDPEVMAQLQQFLMRVGVIRPDGSLRGAPAGQGAAVSPAASASSESGLWTPDAPAAPQQSGDGGGSKLWVPGMD